MWRPVASPTTAQLFYAGNPSAQPAYQYRISNPKSQTYTVTAGGATVTFTLTLNPADAQGAPAYANNKYVDFTSTGARVVDVGIKGGADETRYNYATQPGGSVVERRRAARAGAVRRSRAPTRRRRRSTASAT